MKRIPSLLAASALVVSCSSAPEPPPFKAVAGNRLLMTSVVDPAADVLWGAVGTIVTAEGVEEIQPRSDEEWVAVRNSAVVLAESGNLMMMERRAVDGGDWMQYAQALVEAGEAALLAADSRDPQAVFDVGERVYFACADCHTKYWPEDPTLGISSE